MFMKISEKRFLNYFWFIAIFFIFIGCTENYTPKGADTYRDTTVVASLSTSNPFLVQVNTTGNVTVTFNVTNTQNPAYDLVIDSFTLPAGWTWVTAVPNFGDKSKPLCSNVGIGNCSLTLKFSPLPTTSTNPGTVTIPFSYLTTDRTTRKSSVTNIQYKITTNNTLDTVVNPTTVLTTVGTALPVDVLFSSSDINPVTNVAITLPVPLPAGWTNNTTLPLCTQIASAINTTPPTVPSATCTKTLNLRYNPTNIANSSFTINYTYTASNGVAKSGSKVINYRATSNNTLNVSLSQSYLDTFIYNSYYVYADFTSSDGNPVTNFTISFDGTNGGSNNWYIVGDSCTGASSITNCQMILYYYPYSVTTGTNSMAMAYSYTSNSGFPQGSGFGINYTASYNYIVPKPDSLTFSYAGEVQYITLYPSDQNYTSDLSLTLNQSNSALQIISNDCNNSYGGYVYTSGCQIGIYYDGSSASSGSLVWSYTPYAGPYLSGEGSISIDYSNGDSLAYSYVTGSLEDVHVGNSSYIIYGIYIPRYSIYKSFLDSDSTSYPPEISRVDSSKYGYYPSCDSNESYYGYCYVAFEYNPKSETSGSFDYNAQYGTYDSHYYTFWTYRDLFIPEITYSSIPLIIEYPTWDSNSPPGNSPDYSWISNKCGSGYFKYVVRFTSAPGSKLVMSNTSLYANTYGNIPFKSKEFIYLGRSYGSVQTSLDPSATCSENYCELYLRYNATDDICTAPTGQFDFSYDYSIDDGPVLSGNHLFINYTSN